MTKPKRFGTTFSMSFVPMFFLYGLALLAGVINPSFGIVAFICVTVFLIAFTSISLYATMLDKGDEQK